MNIRAYLKKRKELIDEYIKVVLPYQEGPEKLHEAVWYCMLDGGKRIRAIIMLGVADLAEAPLEDVLNSAAGIEMIHTSTLILDDLPSMDDALLRRSKPALHRVYGEATAILVANILMLEGIRLIQEDLAKKLKDLGEVKELTSELLRMIGRDGIMLGQHLDLALSNQELKLSQIEEIHRRKTASLFEISAKLAAKLSDMNLSQTKSVIDYARNFGMAFQITDDIIGMESKPKVTGKLSLTKDRRPNYLLVCGKRETRRRLNSYIDKAIGSLKGFEKKAEPLVELAKYLKERTS